MPILLLSKFVYFNQSLVHSKTIDRTGRNCPQRSSVSDGDFDFQSIEFVKLPIKNNRGYP